MRLSLLFTTLLATAAAPALAEDVSYDLGGTTYNGYFAAAESPKGLVVIAHDWDGLDDYERGRADELAGMGYDAFALDMYGEGTPTGSVEENRAATQMVTSDRERMRAIIEAGVQAAQEQSEANGFVLMGYCFGGGVALEMARSEMADQAAGYATFHGSLGTPEGQGYSEGVPPILIMHGGADESVTLEDLQTLVNELEGVDADYTAEIYSGAPHAFTVEGSDRYQERADKESWEAFTDFIEERLG